MRFGALVFHEHSACVCWCFKSTFRPQVPDLNELTEEQIRHHLLDFGGTPKHLIEDQDVLRMFIPLLKADAGVVKKFIFDKPSKALLSLDITGFLGSEDTIKDIEGETAFIIWGILLKYALDRSE